jgi:hypothetical protein
MFTIPAEIQTLLKEMQMTGENRPTAELLITGAPNTNVTDPTAWTTWRKFIGDSPVRAYGNMVETEDGRAAISYVESNAVYVATASSVAEILAGTTSFGDGIKVKDCNADDNVQTSLSLIGSQLRLAITNWEWIVIDEEPEAILQVEYWCDTNGTGISFSYVSMIATDLSSGSNWNIEKPTVGKQLSPITELTTNVWVIMCTHYDYIYSRDTCCYTEDGGATWSHGAVTHASLSSVYTGVSASILKLSESSFVVGWASSSDSEMLEYFSNNGAGMSDVSWGEDWVAAIGNKPRSVCFCTIGMATYMARPHSSSVDIYKLLADIPTIDNITDYEDWELITTIVMDGSDTGLLFYVAKSALILQHTALDATRISGAGTELSQVPIPIKSIAIDRSKGGASQAVVVIDNTLGMYAPDSIGDWAHVIWFNKEIQIKMGYGAERQLVFTGLIDDIYMSTYPAELTIKARDYSKLALDQMPQDDFYEGYAGEPRYAFAYYNKTPEYIFGDMATQAGWGIGTVHVEVTGVTLAQFDTGHEKIADCFQRLCELVGWEWFTDEIGDVYFRPARDPSAVSVYSFTEGVDIFSLNYRLCDEELYRTIVVWTSAEDGSAIKASGTWPAADYNNVLPKKTMIVNAGDIVTDEAGCLAMVNAISNGITPKVREVNFVAVGNPYLQIGDLIRVTETTTCISEYYRITEISHQMNSTGSPIFGTGLKCYHFSDFSAEVDPPTPPGVNIVVPDNIDTVIAPEVVGDGADINAKINAV